MPEAVRRRALEPFFTTKGPQSLGLGLSAAYGTVRRHGGTLTLESAEGQGTTATFSLPVAPPVPAAPATPLAASPPLRILVIDDDARVRGTLADLLSTRGHAVVQASSGQEGLAHLGDVDAVDLVITDLGMPDMTGWEVARTVRERWPGLPVGLITGWGDQHLQAAERKQVDFVISKPFEEARLHEALSSLFDRASPRPVA